MFVKSHLLKLLVLPKSATFLFVAFFFVTSLSAVSVQDATYVSTATFLLPPGLGGGK